MSEQDYLIEEDNIPRSYYPIDPSIASYSTNKTYTRHKTKIDPDSKQLTIEQCLDCIRSKVNDLIESKKIPGLSLGIISNNKVIFVEGFGIRNLKNETVTPQTVFQLGEISQTLAIAYHAKYLSFSSLVLNNNIQPSNVKDYSTFTDIYSHRSGYSEEQIGYIKFLTKSQYSNIIDSFSSLSLCKDNTNFRSVYSQQDILFNMTMESAISNKIDSNKIDSNKIKTKDNSNRIISKTINTKIIDELETFTASINMKNTKWGKNSYLQNSNHAKSMQKINNNKSPFVSNYYYDTDSLILSLGASSNLEDLLQFVKLMLNFGELDEQIFINDTNMSQMLSPHIKLGEDAFGALGWTVIYRFGTKLYWKSAIIPTGQRALIIFCIEKNFGFVVLSSTITSYPEALFALSWNLLISKDVCNAYKQYEKYQWLYGKRIKEDISSYFSYTLFKSCNLKKNKFPKTIEATFKNDINGIIKFCVNENNEQLIQIGDTDPVKAKPYERNIWKITWINCFGMPELTQISICFNYLGHPNKISAYIHSKEIIYDILHIHNIIKKKKKEPKQHNFIHHLCNEYIQSDDDEESEDESESSINSLESY